VKEAVAVQCREWERIWPWAVNKLVLRKLVNGSPLRSSTVIPTFAARRGAISVLVVTTLLFMAFNTVAIVSINVYRLKFKLKI